MLQNSFYLTVTLLDTGCVPLGLYTYSNILLDWSNNNNTKRPDLLFVSYIPHFTYAVTLLPMDGTL